MKKRARIYTRVSTLKESQKDSPEHQLSLCEARLKELGLEVVYPVFEDKSTGTSIVARPDVQRMIKEAQAGKFDVICFSSLSRFSRDALDSISLKRILVNALGIRLISIEDFYDSGIDDNELLFGVVSVVNQKLSEQISVSSRRGIRESAMKGNFTGSIAPYGYRKVKIGSRKTLEVDQDRAHIVRMIFDMYTHGMGETSITNHLNEQGIPAYRGGEWGITSVQRILQNEVYTGENVFGKYEVEKVYNDVDNLMDRGKKQVQKKKDSWKRTNEKTHEAIISDELFERAQEIRLIRGGGERGGAKNFSNAFAKIIFCKNCGSAMVTTTSIGYNKKQYRYLICSRRRRVGVKGCVNDKWVPYVPLRDELINYAINQIDRQIDNESGVDTLISHVGFKGIDSGKEMTRVQKVIESNRKLLFEIRKQMMLGDLDSSQYEFEKMQYEDEIRNSEEKLKELQAKMSEQNDKEALYKKMLQAGILLKEIDDYDDVGRLRIALAGFFERIEVDVSGDIIITTPLEKIIKES